MCATGESGGCVQLVRVLVISHAVLSPWSAVVQSNRLNPLGSTSASLQVHFPTNLMEFSEFARTRLIPRVVIPGDFLKALVTGTHVGTVLVLRTCGYSVSTVYIWVQC